MICGGVGYCLASVKTMVSLFLLRWVPYIKGMARPICGVIDYIFGFCKNHGFFVLVKMSGLALEAWQGDF